VKLIVKYFFLAVLGVVLDLDIYSYIFPWQMCFFGGCLRDFLYSGKYVTADRGYLSLY